MQLLVDNSEVFQIALRDSVNFVKTLKIRMKLILNCPRAHAITYTNIILHYQ